MATKNNMYKMQINIKIFQSDLLKITDDVNTLNPPMAPFNFHT